MNNNSTQANANRNSGHAHQNHTSVPQLRRSTRESRAAIPFTPMDQGPPRTRSRQRQNEESCRRLLTLRGPPEADPDDELSEDDHEGNSSELSDVEHNNDIDMNDVDDREARPELHTKRMRRSVQTHEVQDHSQSVQSRSQLVQSQSQLAQPQPQLVQTQTPLTQPLNQSAQSQSLSTSQQAASAENIISMESLGSNPTTTTETQPQGGVGSSNTQHNNNGGNLGALNLLEPTAFANLTETQQQDYLANVLGRLASYSAGSRSSQNRTPSVAARDTNGEQLHTSNVDSVAVRSTIITADNPATTVNQANLTPQATPARPPVYEVASSSPEVSPVAHANVGNESWDDITIPNTRRVNTNSTSRPARIVTLGQSGNMNWDAIVTDGRYASGRGMAPTPRSVSERESERGSMRSYNGSQRHNVSGERRDRQNAQTHHQRDNHGGHGRHGSETTTHNHNNGGQGSLTSDVAQGEGAGTNTVNSQPIQGQRGGNVDLNVTGISNLNSTIVNTTGSSSTTTLSPAGAMQRDKVARTIATIPSRFRNPAYGTVNSEVTPAITAQQFIQPLPIYPTPQAVYQQPAQPVYQPMQGPMYPGFNPQNSLDMAQTRFKLLKEFNDALGAFYTKPQLSKHDDPAELFRAVKWILQLTGMPDGIAVSAIQFKMGADYAEWNRATLPILNLVEPGVFKCYEDLFWEETQADNAKVHELNVEYNTMALMNGESVSDLIARIARAEDILFPRVNKSQQTDYDASTHLYGCINRSKDTRRQHLLDLMDDSDYAVLKYKEICDILIKRDRSRAKRSELATVANYGNERVSTNTGGTINSGTGGRFERPWGYLGAPNEQRKEGVNEAQPQQPQPDRRGVVVSGANAQQAQQSPIRGNTRGPYQQWVPPQGQKVCSYHPNAAHSEEGCDYTLWCKAYAKTTKPYPDWDYVNRNKTGLNNYGSRLREAREETRTQFNRMHQIPYHQQVQANQQQPQGVEGAQPGQNNAKALVHNVGTVVVDNTPAVSEDCQPIRVEQGDSGRNALPCIDVIIEGGIKVRAWLDSLSSACVINPDMIRLTPTTVVKHATGTITGANKEHPSAIIGAVESLVMAFGSATMVGHRVILSRDTPVGFILGYDFIKKHIRLTHQQEMVVEFGRSGERVAFFEAHLPVGTTTLAMTSMESTLWSVVDHIHILPGRSYVATITSTGAAPSEAMLFERTRLPVVEGTPDPNVMIDVVTELVWQDVNEGHWLVPVVNKSVFPFNLAAGTQILVSSPRH